MKKISSTKNFSYEDLPHSRKEQFSDILRHRYMLLVLNAVFILIGFFPLIFVYSNITYLSNTDVFIEFAKAQGIQQNMYDFSYFWLVNFGYLIMIPLFMIAFLFLSGGLRIFRLLAWDEGVFFFSDFFRGIKENFKQAMLIGFFLGLYIFISKFVGGSLTMYVNPNFGIGVEIFTKGLLLIFILPISVISLFLTTYFNEKFFHSVKNSFYIFISKAPIFILLSVILLIIYVFPFIGNIYLIIISVLLVMLLVAPIYVLLWNQCIIGSVDKYNEETSVTNKGLYKFENKSEK